MPFRTGSYRPWLWSFAVFALSAGPVAAQPPSPLELVRGLRENGQVDLALEYLKELESKPLTADDKAALPLERAKCLLEAADDEPDEGSRLGMVSEAKEGLNGFLIAAPNHPRAVEALLALAKLTALDAKEQLNRARRLDIPPVSEDKAELAAREAAQDRQKEEAKKARPLFLLAAKRFSEASDRIRVRLDDKTLDPGVRKTLEREAFEADLANGINQFNTAETYMPASRTTGDEKGERNKYLEQAKATFAKLAEGPQTNRTVWVARAWATEVTFEQDDFNKASNEVTAILKSNVVEAEDGKRLARFFQLRRNFLTALGERNLPKVIASEKELRDWLRVYGNPRKPTPEVFAVRYYLARILQSLGEANIGPPPKDGKPVVVSATARGYLSESERLYRGLSQTDHDFTARASRNRMAVVRRLLGDADQPIASYTTFETAQMASLIKMSLLAAEEGKAKPDEKKVQALQLAAVALLERSRELATPQDNPADVTDVLLRLIYFYQLTDQPYQTAVLGEHVAHTVKGTGGKAALAGLLGLNGYIIASQRVKGEAWFKLTDKALEDLPGEEVPEGVVAKLAGLKDKALTRADFMAALANVLDKGELTKYQTVIAKAAEDIDEGSKVVKEGRQADRARAYALARFLDEKFPNDNATDIARHRLASMLVEDKKMPEAFEVLIRVRPAYAQIINARLLEGYLAQQLINTKDALPDAKKAEVFKRAVADLAKVAKPAPVASEEEVRGYLSVRCRLASLLFLQGRVDPGAEKANPGYNQAVAIAQEVFGLVPTFDHMVTTAGGVKKLNLHGVEMTLLAQETHARALYLRARALIDAGNLDEASKSLEPALAELAKTGPAATAEIKGWGTGAAEPDAAQKGKIQKLADSVDKMRVEVILAGFRLRVRQGKAAEGAALLDLMIKVGGTIEENLPLLEVLGRETAAKMLSLQKEGKAKEATELGAGLAVLLNRITSVPKLSSSQLLFVGQMLGAVKEYDKALETLRKVPEPEFKEWRQTSPDKMQGRVQELTKLMATIEDEVIKKLTPEEQEAAKDPERRPQVVKDKVVPALVGKPKDDYAAFDKERADLKAKIDALPKGQAERHASQMRDYAVGQLAIARVYRESKRFAEAEKMLQDIIGTNEKPSWGGPRLYFRRELATMYEDKGASIPDIKAANVEWSKALKEWGTLFTIHRTRLTKHVPLPPTATAEEQKRWKDEDKQYRNAFADAYFDRQRCVVKANQQLVKDPAKLQKTYDDVGKLFADMEKQIPAADWEPEVQHHYADMLKEVPQMVNSYKAAGGKLFLERLP